MREPSFLSVAQWDRREELRCPEWMTERCERDFLRLVSSVSNSNEIRGVGQLRSGWPFEALPVTLGGSDSTSGLPARGSSHTVQRRVGSDGESAAFLSQMAQAAVAYRLLAYASRAIISWMVGM